MDTKVNLHRYDNEIANLKKRMAEQEITKNGILFYGSSTMAFWRKDEKCYQSMHPLPLVNNGFGGATTEELLYYYQLLVLPVKPSVMVYYSGANDIDKGYTPKEVIELSHRLFEWERQDFPGIQFLIIPVKLSPGMAHHHLGATCNNLFEKYSTLHNDTHILDIRSFMNDSAGNLRKDIYVDDMIHHNEKGYNELGNLIKPVIKRLYQRPQETV